MTAHDAHNVARLEVRCQVVECVGDGVIMKGGAELRCEGMRTLGVGPGVHLGIQA